MSLTNGQVPPPFLFNLSCDSRERRKIRYGTVTDKGQPVSDPLGYLTNRPQNDETSSVLSNAAPSIVPGALLAHKDISEYTAQVVEILRQQKASDVKDITAALGLAPWRNKKDNVVILRNYFGRLRDIGPNSQWEVYRRTLNSPPFSLSILEYADSAIHDHVLKRSAEIKYFSHNCSSNP